MSKKIRFLNIFKIEKKLKIFYYFILGIFSNIKNNFKFH
jgi:hypothetical protein